MTSLEQCPTPLRINLGCGGKKLDGYINVDSQPAAKPDVVLDIGRDIFPWADDSVSVVQAWHIFEHLAPAQFFHCLQQIYRVCAPGAKFGVIVPHPRHDVFLNDPTHVHAITPDGMLLFSKKHAANLRAQGVEGVTSYADYIGVDFDLQEPVNLVMDPRAGDVTDEDLRTRNNLVIEYRMLLKVVK